MSTRGKSVRGPMGGGPVTTQGIPVEGPAETRYVDGLGEVSTKYPVHIYVAADDETPVDQARELNATGNDTSRYEAVVEYATEDGEKQLFAATYDQVERLFDGELSVYLDAVRPQDEQLNIAGPLKETPSSAYGEQQHRLVLKQPYAELTPERPRNAELYDAAKREIDADRPPGGGTQPFAPQPPETEEHDARARLDYRIHTDFPAFKRAAIRERWKEGVDDPAYQ